MLHNRRLSVAMTAIATTLIFSTVSFGQDDAKAMMTECLAAHAAEFQPLKEEQNKVEQQFSSRRYAIQRIIYWLKEDPESANEKRLREIREIEARLAELKANAEMTSEKAIERLADTIENANIMVEDIDDERTLALKPFKRKASALKRKYEEKETALEPVVEGLFRETGDGDASGLTRSYASFNYASGTASGSFKKEGENKTACGCTIYLVNTKPAKKELGMLNDKYPICYTSKSQMEILVGPARVTIYSSDAKYNDKQLGKTLTSLVDLEKLASLVGE